MRKLTMVVMGLLWLQGCAQHPVEPAATPAATTTVAPSPHEDFRTFCTHAACQHDVDIDLIQAGLAGYHHHFELLPPAVQPEVVTVYAGQKVKAAATFKDGRFAGWVEPAAATADDVILTFDLQQGSSGMMLDMHNDSQKMVKLSLYKVDLRAIGGEPQYTSSCPVMAGAGDFETWPEPVFEIDVRSAEISASAAGACN